MLKFLSNWLSDTMGNVHNLGILKSSFFFTFNELFSKDFDTFNLCVTKKWKLSLQLLDNNYDYIIPVEKEFGKA